MVVLCRKRWIRWVSCFFKIIKFNKTKTKYLILLSCTDFNSSIYPHVLLFRCLSGIDQILQWTVNLARSTKLQLRWRCSYAMCKSGLLCFIFKLCFSRGDWNIILPFLHLKLCGNVRIWRYSNTKKCLV